MKEEKQQTVPAERKDGRAGKRALFIVLSVVLALVMFGAGWLGSYLALGRNARSLLWAIDKTQKEYYTELDEEDIYEKLFDALSPDRYSYYMTAEEYEGVLREQQGVNEGVGISVIAQQDGLRVYSVVGNSPAELAGVREGMYLFAYGADEAHLIEAKGDAAALTSFIRENAGPVVLRCGYGEGDAKNFIVTKGSYLASYCSYYDSEAAFLFRGEEKLALTQTEQPLAGLDDKTAYIRIDAFDGNVSAEFAQCLAKMKERGRMHLVLDLRSNGGGYLNDLVSVASHLLREAEGRAPVAEARYRNGNVRRFVASDTDFSAYFTSDSRVTLLADENSASASECLIGALVDYKTIGYGDIYLRAETGRTYGKGIMQSTYRDLHGNAMKLTVAEIFWPVSGKSIHGVGVTVSGDGAVAIEAPALRGERDEMLEQVLARVCG